MQDCEVIVRLLRAVLLVTLGYGFSGEAWGQAFYYEQLVLESSDRFDVDMFGESVSVWNGLVVVGAPRGGDLYRSGAAYIFDADSGEELARLIPDDAMIGDHFGYSVDIKDGLIAVGASRKNEAGIDSGAVYLFDSYSGVQVLKLAPDDGEAEDWFGFPVALGDGIVAVGAYNDDDNGENSGSVYVFDSNTGQQLVKLLAEDGEADDLFGVSISVDDGIVAVGAMLEDVYGSDSGSAYLFQADTGEQIAKLIPGPGGGGSHFGRSIGVDDGIVVVGAPNYGLGGEIYLFDSISGEEIVRMQPYQFVQGNEAFGVSVSLSAGMIVVGATNSAQNQIQSGVVYVASLIQEVTYGVLLPSDGEHRDYFGPVIDIDGGVVVSTKPIYIENGYEHSGLVYVYTSLENQCPADVNQNREYDLNDVLHFESLMLYRYPNADINEDGMLDFFDISLFLTAFSAGCP